MMDEVSVKSVGAKGRGVASEAVASSLLVNSIYPFDVNDFYLSVLPVGEVLQVEAVKSPA